jgi:hypothetical protein
MTAIEVAKLNKPGLMEKITVETKEAESPGGDHCRRLRMYRSVSNISSRGMC